MTVAKIVIQTTILVGADSQAAAIAGVKKHLPELRQLLEGGLEDLGTAVVDVFEVTNQETLSGDALIDELEERDLDAEHMLEYEDEPA